jgi:hypothetical protein
MLDNTFDLEQGVAGFEYKGRLTITDGHHRMAAALRYYVNMGNDIYIRSLIINGRFHSSNPKAYGIKSQKFPIR